MSPGKWTIRVSAKVRADPHSVVGYFQGPDRSEELLAALAMRGMTNCTVDVSYTDSVQIRDIRCNTPKGSANHRRSEAQLGPDGGVGTWSGDRFVVVDHVIIQDRSTAGRLKTKEFDQTTAFEPANGNRTEIVLTYSERLIAPRWYEWLLPPITERARKHADQRGQIDRSELFDGLIEGVAEAR